MTIKRNMVLDENAQNIEITNMFPHIDINLNPGVYTFGSISGDGKTRLAKSLKLHMLNNEEYVSLTYDDYLFSADACINKIKAGGKVLFLDRYDLYNGSLDSEMQEFAKKGVVLVDCKEGLDFQDDVAIIHLDKYYIGVRG